MTLRTEIAATWSRLGVIGAILIFAGCAHPPVEVAGNRKPHHLRRPEWRAWLGSTPRLDGELSPGEWSDADRITGVVDWVPEFSPVKSGRDLAVTGWVKHDATHLHFAFDVRDDILYGLDTDRWLPKENPLAHELTRAGYPWFGDEMELLLNAAGTWQGDEGAAGNGKSWQMVCNLFKSRLGGLGVGGLLEGEPRTELSAWETYARWIQSGAQRAAVRMRPDHRGYVIEWSVAFDPCIEVATGVFYSPSKGESAVGLNVAVGDLDRPSEGAGNFGSFHHEQWWAGAPHTRTQLNNFGILRLMGRTRP